MSTSVLFTPIRIADHTFANRIVISPMCQYSAENGCANDWHLMHLGMLSNSGAGLLIVEATAVEPEGRISPGDLGLYDDANEAALARVLAACRRYGTAKLGIQISHAGRKASAHTPWHGGGPLRPEEGAWQAVALDMGCLNDHQRGTGMRHHAEMHQVPVVGAAIIAGILTHG